MSGSYISWGAILAGAAVTCAISAVLLHFGAAIGLTGSTQYRVDEAVKAGAVITVGIWIVWVQILSSLAGGYLAGRMRTPVTGANNHEREVRDGIHGLVVWAVATLAVIVGATLVSTLASLAPVDPTAAKSAAEVAENILHNHKNAAIIFAFLTASGSLISGVASWWSATKGGDHRDTQIDLGRHLSFQK